jgi:hypothetical protein
VAIYKSIQFVNAKANGTLGMCLARSRVGWVPRTFLMKRLPNVRTEMSLHVLAYNLKRAMQIFGVAPLMKIMRA